MAIRNYFEYLDILFIITVFAWISLPPPEYSTKWRLSIYTIVHCTPYIDLDILQILKEFIWIFYRIIVDCFVS